MNNRYFACPNCRVYIDVGYRWAYWLLEDVGHVKLNEGVNVDNILALNNYWNPPPDEQKKWLCEKILPKVKVFLSAHKEHGIIYLESDTIFCEESLYYNWIEIETD